MSLLVVSTYFIVDSSSILPSPLSKICNYFSYLILIWLFFNGFGYPSFNNLYFLLLYSSIHWYKPPYTYLFGTLWCSIWSSCVFLVLVNNVHKPNPRYIPDLRTPIPTLFRKVLKRKTWKTRNLGTHLMDKIWIQCFIHDIYFINTRGFWTYTTILLHPWKPSTNSVLL